MSNIETKSKLNNMIKKCTLKRNKKKMERHLMAQQTKTSHYCRF